MMNWNVNDELKSLLKDAILARLLLWYRGCQVHVGYIEDTELLCITARAYGFVFNQVYKDPITKFGMYGTAYAIETCRDFAKKFDNYILYQFKGYNTK